MAFVLRRKPSTRSRMLRHTVCMPDANCPPTMAFCAAPAEMHGLRIEFGGECLDGLAGNQHGPGLDDLSDGEILVAAHRHAPARRSTRQVANLKCMTSPSATTY